MDDVNPQVCEGRSCSMVAAVNLMQVLHTMAREEGHLDLPSMVQKAYEKVPTLRRGRLNNGTVMGLIQFFSKWLPDHNIKQTVDVLQRETDVPKGFGFTRLREEIDPSYLVASAGQIKMLVTRLYSLEGELVGRHFVLIKENRKGNIIAVQEPVRIDKTYIFQLRKLPSPAGGRMTWQLVKPNGNRVEGYQFEIDSVITVSLD
jgi:hypothetical protein